MSLLLTVERHLRRAAVPPSRFGRDVAGDPRFVFDLRRGREPRTATRDRVLAFIAKAQSAAPSNTQTSDQTSTQTSAQTSAASTAQPAVQPAARAGMPAGSRNGLPVHSRCEVA